jgi:hypothetical protein
MSRQEARRVLDAQTGEAGLGFNALIHVIEAELVLNHPNKTGAEIDARVALILRVMQGEPLDALTGGKG